MLFVGTIVGSPVIGWLSDRLRRRQMPMVMGAIIALMLVLILMYAPHLSLEVLLIVFLILGFITSTQIISYPLIAESPLALTGTAEGLAAVLIMAGGFTQPMFARLMQWHWTHHFVHHIPVFSQSDYQWALAIMPVAFILALVMALLVRETSCRNRHTKG